MHPLDFHQLVDSCEVSIISLTLEGVITSWNPSAEALYGFSSDEALGANILDLTVPVQLHPKLAPLFKRVCAGEHIAPYETIRRHKDGSTITISIAISAIQDAEGSVYGISSIARDVSERVSMDRTYRLLAEAGGILSSSLDYDTTLSAVANLIVPELADWCTIDLLEDGQIRSVAVAHNDPQKLVFAHEYAAKYPVSMDDIRGAANVIRTGESELIPVITDEMITRGARDEEHLRLTRQLQLCSYSILPLIARGRTLGALTLLSAESGHHFTQRDVSIAEQLAVRAALAIDNAQLFKMAQQAKDQLEARVIERTNQLQELNIELGRSNRELQDFASVASHDLQEPLRKILAFGDRLRSSTEGTLSESSADYLERMLQAADRMRSLTEDLLAFARVTTKAQPFAPVDLNRVVEDAISNVENRIQESGAQVTVAHLPIILGDHSQLCQLFQNLIANGLKFHRPNIPPEIRIWCEECNDSLCIQVEDNGIGFEQKYVDRIFTIFQRLHGRSEYEGTGIGLAICRKIVERHEGVITATSEIGKGSTFSIELPVTCYTDEL